MPRLHPFRSFARLATALTLGLGLAACVPAYPVATGPQPAAAPSAIAAPPTFAAVVTRLEPVVESVCRARVQGRSCAFSITIDNDASKPANAFQTLDAQGRPIVVFTVALLEAVQNTDELAFVLGHEAAHHIAGHIPRRQDQAMTGAMLAGALAQATGLSAEEIKAAQSFGADLAARQYSKDFELEADALGAEIAYLAGFDPVRGAAFFARLPDPGDRFLGSHPPNAQRRAVVAATVTRLKQSGIQPR